MGINRVNISGNLTRDPELRQTAGGMQVLSFGVAVNDRAKNQQTGQWEDRANFVDCTMFGNRAQAVSQYIRKGSKVAIEGKLRWSSWDDRQTGQKRSKLEVIVDEVEFMDARPQNGNQAPQQAYGQVAQAVAQAQPYGQQQPQQQPVYADSNIPF